jgi:Superinfection immunity protein
MNIEGTVLLITFLAIYFLPWIVAASRHHHQRAAICVLNTLLGWTLLGWIAALVWASTAVHRYQHA